MRGGDIVGGRATGTNLCSGRGCPGFRRRYFLTQGFFFADQVLDPATCGEGFHVASEYELHDPSNLEYDFVRGATSPHSGHGPPASFDPPPPSDLPDAAAGWMRTGRSNLPNEPHCRLWTSTSSSDRGRVGYLDHTIATDPSPWALLEWLCSDPQRAWCIAD